MFRRESGVLTSITPEKISIFKFNIGLTLKGDQQHNRLHVFLLIWIHKTIPGAQILPNTLILGMVRVYIQLLFYLQERPENLLTHMFTGVFKHTRFTGS